jgi:hypothetical protein
MLDVIIFVTSIRNSDPSFIEASPPIVEEDWGY